MIELDHAKRNAMRCLFCQIATRAIPASIVYEDDKIMAFLDLYPIRPGHTQIIPKDHYPYFEDIPTVTAQRLFEAAQAFSRTMKGLYQVRRVALVFTGGDVPHAHAHLVPMHEETDITSRCYIVEKELTFRCMAKATPEELEYESKRLKDSLRIHADLPKDNPN